MSTASVEPLVFGRPGPNLIFVGPPGAGKGSLAAKLCSLNLEHVSSGDFFRAEVARGTALGAQFSASLKKGEFIRDELTLGVMRKWYFSRKGARGFLLDGFPRNLLQATVFAEWMETKRERLDACLYLKVDREESIRRISGRRVCPVDGSVYHVDAHPPKVPGICDRCGEPLVQRSDDKEETVNHRWALFEKATLPVVEYYRERGILLSFDAAKSAVTLEREVMAAVMGLN